MSFRYRVEGFLVRGFARFLSPELRQAIKNIINIELKAKIKEELKEELKKELKEELKKELKKELEVMQRQLGFVNSVRALKQRIQKEIGQEVDVATKLILLEDLSGALRTLVRQTAGLPDVVPSASTINDLVQEITFLRLNQELLAPVFKLFAHKRALFVGQAYYNAWYLSRALRSHGWKADVLNWDLNPDTQIYYHGQDFAFDVKSPTLTEDMLHFYVSSLYKYDVFHFSNAQGISFGWPVQQVFTKHFFLHSEIFLIKDLGKKVVYSNNGCLDGVSQSAFAMWGPESVCSICRWRNEPIVCSDERNLAWGKFRNSVADYQCLLGGNRADYNEDPRVHEVPEFYCLDEEVWHPQIAIPEAFRLPLKPQGTVWLYHAIGHKADRTTEDGVNIKSSHVYLPLVQKLKEEGLLLELLEPTGIPNKDVRFLQAQADIFLEMLTFGWFGANAREAMMLGKPVICYIRPEWLESLREEIPDYAAELPVISATPESVEEILRDLIANPEKRRDVGQRSRLFAMKWHSSKAAGLRFDEIYSRLLQGDPLLRGKG